MCIALIAIAMDARYPLVLLHNRDEYHARRSKPAFWQAGGFLAGLDLSSGGTWLGVKGDGTFAFVTNYRHPAQVNGGQTSRGLIVPAYLSKATLPVAGSYKHFNFIYGHPGSFTAYASVSGTTDTHTKGVFALSNAFLETPWPKVVRIKDEFQRVFDAARGEEELAASLLGILQDTWRPEDAALPQTGLSLESERLVSSVFVVSPRYGTQCSTVFLADAQGRYHFLEARYDAAGSMCHRVWEHF